MTEHPILFSAPMVRAILEGRKTVTRRIACSGRGVLHSFDGEVATFGDSIPDDPLPMRVRCRYGVPGDQLWCRETWGYRGSSWVSDKPDEYELHVAYQADGVMRSFPAMSRAIGDRLDKQRPASEDESWEERERYLTRYWRSWRPSIHMPRWAGRITLEVVSVRVERLQDITAADARAEGIDQSGDDQADVWNFSMLWNTINFRRAPWDSNPWIWRVEFRRLP